jgi:hypothetical protein
MSTVARPVLTIASEPVLDSAVTVTGTCRCVKRESGASQHATMPELTPQL